MDKAKAIELLTTAIQGLESFKGGTDSADPRLRRWRLDTGAMLERVFGLDSRPLADFNKIGFSPTALTRHGDQAAFDREGYQRGFDRMMALLSSARHEIEEFWEMDHASTEAKADPLDRIEKICERFHVVARQLRHRHDQRVTLDVGDEYDVQDLLHALLMLDFHDVRAEEWTPSYAGASSRMDFLLKHEQIVLEAKKTRKGLTGKEVGEQLLVDCQRYQSHPDCKMLVCFVYDPEGLIANPRGLEADLATAGGDLTVKMYIRP